jgi:hypothetical protein
MSRWYNIVFARVLLQDTCMEEPEEEEEQEEPAQSTASGAASSVAPRSMEAVIQYLDSQKIPHHGLISLGGSSAHHYTDLNGLRGIVEEDDLWLTKAEYSNDEDEMTHGYEIARRVINEEKKKAAEVQEHLYLDHLTRLIHNSSAEVLERYVCCFCMKGDLLSQWRGYGAYGTGVDLEIDIMGFSDLTANCSCGSLYYWKVRYKDTEKEQRVKEIVDHFRSTAQENAGHAEERAGQAAAAIQFFIPTFKDERFEEETEWRLIFAPSLQHAVNERVLKLEFRVSRNLLVPYYRLRSLIPASAEPVAKPWLRINKVTVGPNPNKDLIKQSVRMLLSQNGHAPNVEVSRVPFRG